MEMGVNMMVMQAVLAAVMLVSARGNKIGGNFGGGDERVKMVPVMIEMDVMKVIMMVVVLIVVVMVLVVEFVEVVRVMQS